MAATTGRALVDAGMEVAAAQMVAMGEVGVVVEVAAVSGDGAVAVGVATAMATAAMAVGRGEGVAPVAEVVR